MRRIRRLALAGCLAASPALATEPVCALNGLEPLPVLEAIKAHLLAGTYHDLATDVANVFPEGALAKPIAPLLTMAPKGFDSCSTVARRTEQGGLVQEITLFTGLNKSGRPNEVLGFYLVTAPVGGETKWILLAFNGQITELIEELR